MWTHRLALSLSRQLDDLLTEVKGGTDHEGVHVRDVLQRVDHNLQFQAISGMQLIVTSRMQKITQPILRPHRSVKTPR